MNQDPIIEELHEIRRQLAAEHGNNLQRLGNYLMQQQEQNALKSDAFRNLSINSASTPRMFPSAPT